MNEWQQQPDSDGWWLWMEEGEFKPDRLLLSGGGKIVASDDEWEAAMDRKPSEVMGENYWESTDTQDMPGLWQKASE